MAKKDAPVNPPRLRLLDDRVLVQPDEANQITPGGIVLPDQAKEKPARGTVISVGPGLRLESGERSPLAVNVGDRVLYTKFGGAEVEHEGREMKMLREGEIFAVIEQ